MSSTSDRRRPSIAVVVSGWPRVSETFAVNELLALHEAGMLAAVFATKPGDRSLCQPGARRLDRHVHVLPDGPLADQAAFVTDRLAGEDVAAIHGYFAHRPAAVASAAAARLGVPYGFSAHALDVRKVAAADLAAQVAGASAVIACNADVATSLTAAGATPLLVGHGVDVDHFTPLGRASGSEQRLLAVGRLVAKKGFDVLIEAVLRTTIPCRLTIVGAGPDRHELQAAIERHRLTDRVVLAGRLTHEELPTMYGAADVVVVPSRVDGRGDRDGLPNVVLEAMAGGRPVIASDVAAIATAVVDDHNGVLVAPDDPAALARAIDALGADPVRRHRLGAQARADAVVHHDLSTCAARFVATMERAYG